MKTKTEGVYYMTVYHSNENCQLYKDAIEGLSNAVSIHAQIIHDKISSKSKHETVTYCPFCKKVGN